MCKCIIWLMNSFEKDRFNLQVCRTIEFNWPSIKWIEFLEINRPIICWWLLIYVVSEQQKISSGDRKFNNNILKFTLKQFFVKKKMSTNYWSPWKPQNSIIPLNFDSPTPQYKHFICISKTWKLQCTLTLADLLSYRYSNMTKGKNNITQHANFTSFMFRLITSFICSPIYNYFRHDINLPVLIICQTGK